MKATWLDGSGSIGEEQLRDEGVYYARHDPSEPTYRGPIDTLKRDRGYIEEDIVALSPSTPGLDALCQKFVGEHLHGEDEVRFVLEGQGIFDIRSRDDRYMRVEVGPGDLIVVPEKRYHRFMLTEQQTIRCVRLFKDKAGWEPHYRD